MSQIQNPNTAFPSTWSTDSNVRCTIVVQITDPSHTRTETSKVRQESEIRESTMKANTSTHRSIVIHVKDPNSTNIWSNVMTSTNQQVIHPITVDVTTI